MSSDTENDATARESSCVVFAPWESHKLLRRSCQIQAAIPSQHLVDDGSGSGPENDHVPAEDGLTDGLLALVPKQSGENLMDRPRGVGVTLET